MKSTPFLVTAAVVLVLSTVLFSILAYGQREAEPFGPLQEHLQKQGGVWCIRNREVAAVFQRCRRACGRTFQRDLLMFVGDDPEKHYWCATYLSSEGYLHGELPDFNLAIILYLQASEICQAKKKADGGSMPTIETNYCGAVLCQKQGFPTLAKAMKRRVKKALGENPALAGSFPSMKRSDQEIYSSIQEER